MPLPPAVTLFPRTINVSSDVMRLVFPGIAFVGMGAAFIAAVATTTGFQETNALAFLTLSSSVLFGIPIWMTYRLWRTIEASRDQKAGVLRQGVFVGPQGVLVRLIPNWCYPIPLDRFVAVKEWGGDDDEYLRIETRDGPVDFTADHVAANIAELERAVAAVKSHRTM